MTEQSAAQPRLLAEIDRLLDSAGATDAPERSGALWRLEEDERQLDANVIRLPARHRIEVHREPDVDVLPVVLAGEGTVHTDEGALTLAPHALLWLPHGSQRAIEAGSRGLSYLTVHRKRTGMRIQLPRDAEALRRLEAREEEAEGGEPACLLPRLCPECGAPNERSSGQACSTCGAELTR
ncbi:zinc ribbon domain-containing protein [Actinospica robiniae]|uniref:zinc ribbon domain-containing protein n=1 Tax=Actinospica robiniae TaxID=304901 RepID=UPI000419A1FB|nr:zinc ribbon domain-containing protein [Actinospica robiniae]